ncbi:DASS family sodium-coupled anion symporter [Paraferrimonas sp. SM1919]|uniref:SLC13 family permease n=1 Tax=Paraferrimonas sp. SM1919 TaxID=2662263 RepID=UPI0013D151EC|nr:SLC13 family permease [Paraferrimonas sp. SM1919]
MSRTNLYLVLGPILALISYFTTQSLGLTQAQAAALAVTVLTVCWWVTEALPIPATSLVPFALLPLSGVLTHQQVSSSFGSHVILLLMGAFMLSSALEKSGAHRRLALYMIKLIGSSSAYRLVLGFMLTTALLSMWISNTATTLIMLPVAMAILSHVDNKKLTIALILGIAYAASVGGIGYAASVGGIGTPIGTPPNVIFMAIYQEQTGTEFSFAQWMQLGVPVVICAIPLMTWWLVRGVKLEQAIKLTEVGPWRVEERRTLILFALTAVAWITKSAPFGGWSGLLGLSGIGDGTVAMLFVVLMFITPNGKGDRVLDWDTAKGIPWGMLLLFAGGIALAKGFSASGLSELLGLWLQGLANLDVLLMMLTICLVVTYLTEVTSNTATATLLMPILAAAAMASGFDPSVFMIPAAMCASCAFMLPVATAPNAIVYGTGEINIKDMVAKGAVLSLFASVIIALVCYAVLI